MHSSDLINITEKLNEIDNDLNSIDFTNSFIDWIVKLQKKINLQNQIVQWLMSKINNLSINNDNDDDTDYDERICDLENIGAELRLIEIEKHLAIAKTPYRCPVCEGEGEKRIIDNLAQVEIKSCKPCEGKGILWG